MTGPESERLLTQLTRIADLLEQRLPMPPDAHLPQECRERRTLAALTAELAARGYRAGAPPRRDGALIYGPSIDRSVAAGSPCEACGHVGLGYRSFFNDDGMSYVAVCVCPVCGEASEF